jgi:hypothetical protein
MAREPTPSQPQSVSPGMITYPPGAPGFLCYLLVASASPPPVFEVTYRCEVEKNVPLSMHFTFGACLGLTW